MAKKSMILKQQAPAKFSTRKYNRCKICGRPHAYLRNYGICRICFRELAYKGQIPGVRKASFYAAKMPAGAGLAPPAGSTDRIDPGDRVYKRMRKGHGQSCIDMGPPHRNRQRKLR